MSLGVVTGIADRACAFVLAGYCGVTALLWKQFWKPGDFWISNTGQGRSLFWDFLKNFALGAGLFIFNNVWYRCPLGPPLSCASIGIIPAVRCPAQSRRAAMNENAFGSSQTKTGTGQRWSNASHASN